jgi:hypothetical protein
MADYTLEQQQAIAMAEAKMRMAQASGRETNRLGVPVGEGERIMQPEPQQPRKLMDYISPIAEVPATLLSGAALALPSPFVNPQKPLEFAGKYAYKPQSPVSQEDRKSVV